MRCYGNTSLSLSVFFHLLLNLPRFRSFSYLYSYTFPLENALKKGDIMRRIILIGTFLASVVAHAQMQPGFKDFDVASGLASSNPVYLADFNGKLYFYATDGSVGKEPYYVDGSGTPVLIKDVNPGISASVSNNYQKPSALMNGKYYFTSDNGFTGQEMYVYDGTNTPTIVFDPNFGPDSSSPDNYTVLNGKLYYSAITSGEGRELWVYNGSANTRLTDVNNGPASSITGPVIDFANRIFFVCNTPQYGSELWSYNPVTDTTILEADIDSGASSSNPANLTVLGGKLYFSATTFLHGRELYVYDGTGLPQRLTDISADGLSSLSPVRGNAFALYKGKIYFNGKDTSGQGHLWNYDPTNDNVTLAHKVNPNGDASPREFVVYNDRLFFTVNDGANGFELYAYDGTNSPAIIGDLCPGPNSSLPSELTPIGNELYFTANNCNNSGIDLFSYNHERVGVRNVLFDADVQIYPNPVDRELHIDITLKRDEQLQIRLADVNGRNIYDGGLLPYLFGKNKTDIPMKNLPPGNYIYYLTNKEGTTYLTGKVVKQ